MGKRYYCDFCDRSFADSGVNRKNHFRGSIHQRFRKQHYDAFRDAATILAEDAAKLPCTRFQNGKLPTENISLYRTPDIHDWANGTCDYDDSCKYSHMTTDKRRHLETRVAYEREQKKKREEDLVTPSLEDWLAKRRKLSQKDDTTGETIKTSIQYELPPFLACIPNLPPSLLPPTTEEIDNTTQCDWG